MWFLGFWGTSQQLAVNTLTGPTLLYKVSLATRVYIYTPAATSSRSFHSAVYWVASSSFD